MFTCGSIIEGASGTVEGSRVLSYKLTAEMAGVVLETLSNRKLLAFGIVLLLIQIGFFLIGGLVGEYYHRRTLRVNSSEFCERYE